jgi:hypothetical protein
VGLVQDVPDPVDVVSLVAVVFGAGLTTTGGLDNTRPAPQERILVFPPGATLRSSATGGRQPGIAPRTARPRTRRTWPLLGTAAMTNVRSPAIWAGWILALTPPATPPTHPAPRPCSKVATVTRRSAGETDAWHCASTCTARTWIPSCASRRLAPEIPSSRRITSETVPSGWVVTANAGGELAAPKTNTAAALAPATPRLAPAIIGRRQRGPDDNGPSACDNADPYLRSTSRQRFSSNRVIAGGVPF